MQVLVVDNDQLILEFMKDTISGEGHEILTAEDGLSALDLLKKTSPDIIFTDWIMPNIDGRRLCRIIRGMDHLKNTALVVVSSVAAEEEIDFSELGVQTCLVKGPFDEMANHIRSILEKADSKAYMQEQVSMLGVENIIPRGSTEELLAVKRHFEIILERMAEGILEVTLDGRIIYSNPTALSLIDMPEEDLLGSRIEDLFSGEDRKKVAELLVVPGIEPKVISDDRPLSLGSYLVNMCMLSIEGRDSSSILILNNVTERKRAERALQKRNQELGLLNKFSHTLTSTLELDQVFAILLEEVRRILEVSGTTIWLIDDDSGELVCRQATGEHGKSIEGWRLSPGEGLAGWVASKGESLIVEDTRSDDRHLKSVDKYTGMELLSIMSVPLTTKGNVIGVLQVVDIGKGRFDNSHLSLLEALGASAAVAIENASLYKRAQQEIEERASVEANLQRTLSVMRKSLDVTIQAMAMTVERRDPYTAGHQRRVADLARAIATEMGLSEEQIDGIRIAGSIHDIGKISVPAEILSKPGSLSDKEFALIQDHPQIGFDILKEMEFPWPIAKIVRQHHEKLDGSGYPLGIKGEDILLEAKIITVADVVEAMGSHRPYRPSLGIEKALGHVKRERGVLYDEKVVNACLSLFEEKKFSFDKSVKKDIVS